MKHLKKYQLLTFVWQIQKKEKFMIKPEKNQEMLNQVREISDKVNLNKRLILKRYLECSLVEDSLKAIIIIKPVGDKLSSTIKQLVDNSNKSMIR